MDLRKFLDDVERERAAVDAALRLIGPDRPPGEVLRAAEAARERLGVLGHLLAVRRLEVDMQRRQLLTAVPALIVTPWAAQRLAAATVDTGWVDAARDVLRAASDAYPAAHLPGLAAALGAHLATLRRRLADVMAPTVRDDLTGVTGRTALVAGWAAMGAGDHGRAREHFRLADAAASMTADGTLRAAALTGAANLDSLEFIDLPGGAPAALRVLDAAAHQLGPTTPGVVAAGVYAARARERAAGGEAWEHDLDAAYAHDVTPAATGDLAGLYYGRAELPDREAACLRLAGHAERSAAVVLAELDTPAARLPRRRGKLLAALAAAHAAAGEPEQATRDAHAALDMAARTGSATTTERVRTLAAALPPAAGVAELRERARVA